MSVVLWLDYQQEFIIFALTFTRYLCLVLLRPAKTSLMLWLDGNDFIQRAALSGSCKVTKKTKQTKNLCSRKWEEICCVFTKLGLATSKSDKILRIRQSCKNLSKLYILLLNNVSVNSNLVPLPGNPRELLQKTCSGSRDLNFESCPGAGNSTRTVICGK